MKQGQKTVLQMLEKDLGVELDAQLENSQEIEAPIYSEQIQMWHDEAEDIDMQENPLTDKLQDILQDINYIGNAFKMCVSLQELKGIYEQEPYKIINLTHIYEAFKQRIESGEIPACKEG